MTRWIAPVVGVLLTLIGVVWTLQGAGVMAGSVMTGSKFWLVVGILAVAAGITLIVRSLRRGTPA